MASKESPQPPQSDVVLNTSSVSAKPRIQVPILALLNSVALLAVLGFIYYTKLVYKKPEITETEERKKLTAIQTAPTVKPLPILISFEPITANIKTSPAQTLSADKSTQPNLGKLHYATVSFSLEIRDSSEQELIENLRTFILDKIIQILGHKQFHELTTDQGRYILSAELISAANHFAFNHSKHPSNEPLVTHVYFTQFIVQ